MTESEKRLVTPLIFDDEPVLGGETAHFQFEAYANTLARLVAAKTTRTPLTIGVFGEWGTGKTTLLRAIQARLDETEKLGKKDGPAFLTGDSRYGCADTAGNVWEWCLTKWEDSYKDYKSDNNPEGTAARVLRGGAFLYYQGGARCAWRDGYLPDLWVRNLGFRVVVAPG
ncbi:MAG: SUMF1/EgtB/PvdO family nonheme iron enzyme [Anaerolineae bacterium]|jgi:formylglycine-generating enzyme required for sulfatase activity